MHTHYIQFFTATCIKWLPLLKSHTAKQIILDSLSFLVEKKRIGLYGFVIMPNHIHLIWKIDDNQESVNVQRDFLKYTGQQIRFHLKANDPQLLSQCEVNLKDRRYQFWKRNSLSVDLWSREVVEQKLDYLHANPVSGKWSLVKDFTDYEYSSAAFYEKNENTFPFLAHYMECFGA